MAEGSVVPQELRYSKDHEWVRLEGDVATIGISDHAQHALGDVTYVELPAIGKQVKQFQEIAAVESAKAASDIFSPVAGTVAEINKVLEDAPEKINASPYADGWLCKLKGVSAADLNNLLTAKQYQELLEREQ